MNTRTKTRSVLASVLVSELLLASMVTSYSQPVITTQPQDQTNYVGTTATFSVAATGTGGLSYQWQKLNVAFADIADQTNATLALTRVQLSDAADYRVVVSDTTGATISSSAHLYVSPPDRLFISQPAPGLVTLSWQGTMRLLLSRSLGCPVWVLVGGASPATISLTSDNPFDGGVSGTQFFFKLVALPSLAELYTDFNNNLDIARSASVDPATGIRSSEACVADYLLMAPVVWAQGYAGPHLTANPFAQEALSIGIELGDTCISNEEVIWIQRINFLTYGP